MIAKILPNTINLEQSWESLTDSQVQKEMMETRFSLLCQAHGESLRWKQKNKALKGYWKYFFLSVNVYRSLTIAQAPCKALDMKWSVS